jgi:hypothetical protein
MLTDLVRPLVPQGIRHALRQQHRAHCLARAVRRLKTAPAKADLADHIVRDLLYGWNNPWSVQEEVIRALWSNAWGSIGPILECGSGLSTLLLAVVAERRHVPFISLEHDATWHGHIVHTLGKHGLHHARVVLSPLVHHEDHDWYQVPDHLPEGFGLVVCDGPPGDTFGGRYGLLPAMGSRIAHDCVILMDDAGRPGERGVLERWMHEHATTHRIEGTAKPFAVVSVDGPRFSTVAQPLGGDPARSA